jgi:hypothetical protein
VPILTPDPLPVSEATHGLTSLNVQPSDSLLYSIPSNLPFTSPMPSLIAASESETEGDRPDVTNTPSLSEICQDGRPSLPINGSMISPDSVPCQSHSGALISSPRYPQMAGGLDNGTSMPTSPIPSQRDMESHSPSPLQAQQTEMPSVPESGENASNPPSDPSTEISDTRQQEPPFMTDGRGRVVWSCSGVKRGGSPLAARGQDRIANAAGDRE